eukprot:COSAG04_NODE_209_length_20232_cov_116.817315_2_plen_202_part_00
MRSLNSLSFVSTAVSVYEAMNKLRHMSRHQDIREETPAAAAPAASSRERDTFGGSSSQPADWKSTGTKVAKYFLEDEGKNSPEVSPGQFLAGRLVLTTDARYQGIYKGEVEEAVFSVGRGRFRTFYRVLYEDGYTEDIDADKVRCGAQLFWHKFGQQRSPRREYIHPVKHSLLLPGCCRWFVFVQAKRTSKESPRTALDSR